MLRRRHESAQQSPPVAQPTDAIVAGATLQREVVGHVLQMEAAYRDTLLLRYWEDLSPKQVAQRMGVPIDTVYARLRRGLARLRTRLQSENSDWRATLAPVALGSAALGSP